jgi:hypothetical protein
MIRLGLGLRIIICAALLSAVAAHAQQPVIAPAGPVPSPILSAKKIFLSISPDDWGSSGINYSFYKSYYPFYDQLYKALRDDTPFEVVADPFDADLVFETNMGGTSVLRLVIYDRRTHFVLWILQEHIEPATLQKNRDKNLNNAVSAIILDFETIAGKAPAATH